MPSKLRDLAVKTGEYTDQNGNTKGRWQNVGALMKGDDGGEFLLLARWFNPAGLPNPQGRESVLVSCFPLKDQQPNQAAQQPQPASQPDQPPSSNWNDPPF